MRSFWSRSAEARAVLFCWNAIAFSGSDMEASTLGESVTEVLPMLTISDFLGANRVELERIARTVGLDMMSILIAR